MKIAFFDTHQFEKTEFLKQLQLTDLQIEFFDVNLNSQTASLAKGAEVVCAFVNDKLDRPCLTGLKNLGVKLIALRSAGYNHIDVQAAKDLGLSVCRVPSYSPYAIAEYTVALLLTLNRKIHRSVQRVKELNFSLEGLTGFDLNGKTVGVIGTGRIGKIFAQIMLAFGCDVLAYDLNKDESLAANEKVTYTDLETLCKKSDVVSLHVPLTSDTHHLIDRKTIGAMKPGVLLINTGRGALIDAKALIDALKTEKIGGAALDVYEEEENVFFHDLSNKILQDDILARLLTFPNVVITSHQAFLTREALENIAASTLSSIQNYRTGKMDCQAPEWVIVSNQ